MADLPLAVKVAREFQNDLNAQDPWNSTTGFMVRRWRKVESQLEVRIMELAEEVGRLQADGEAVPEWKIYQLGRYQRLLAQVQGQLVAFGRDVYDPIRQAGLDAQQLGLDHAIRAIDTFGENGLAEAALGFDKLPVAAVEKITALAQAGQPLQALLSKAYPIGAAQMTHQLVTGAALGWNPRKTARAMMGGLSAGFNHVLLVARDQQIRNYREATRDAFQRSGLVQKYRRLAARNERTCMACIGLDGEIFDTAEVMPLHPQDRCVMIPIIDGYPPPTWQPTAREWFRQQPEDTQRKMMGPGAHKLWKDGRIRLKDMVVVKPNSVWGPSAQVSSLSRLKRLAGVEDPPPTPPPPTPPPAEEKQRPGEAARARLAEISEEYEARRKALAAEAAGIIEEQKRLTADQDALRHRLMEEGLAVEDRVNHPEWIDLYNKIQGLHSKKRDYLQAVHQLRSQRKQAQREVVYLPEEDRTQFRPVYGRADKKKKARWKQGSEEFRKMVGKDVLGSVDVPIQVRVGKRSKELGLSQKERSCQYRGEVFMDKYSGADVAIHELGHVIEHYNPDVLGAAVEFWRSRTQGDVWEEMYEPGSEEYTKKDDFSEKYAGKVYGYERWDTGQKKWIFDKARADKDTDGSGIRATELISMGLQDMWKDPLAFAESDPDYFDFIYDLMRGIRR